MDMGKIAQRWIFVAALIGPATAGAALLGPVYPAPGGNNFSASGGNAGDVGGRTNSYTNFDTSAFSELYWGASSASLPGAALDGSLDPMTFAGIAGNVATWTGTTSWTNPDNNNFFANVQTRLEVTVSGLGATPWVSFLLANGSDPNGVGAVVDNSLGVPFSANIAFFANTGSGWQSLNLFEQPTSSQLTKSSFSGAFYSVAPVPLPAAAWLLLSGLAGLGLVGRRKQRNADHA